MGKESTKKSPPRSCFLSGNSSEKKRFDKNIEVGSDGTNIRSPDVKRLPLPTTIVLPHKGRALFCNALCLSL